MFRPAALTSSTIRRDVAREAFSADGDDAVAFAHVEPGFGQRRIVLAVPRVAAIDALDAVSAAIFVPAQVRAEKAALVLRRLAIVAAPLVGVRRAELALHLPNQIGELAARANARQHGSVAVEDAIPIDVAHVFDPELFGLQPPGFAIHLRPLVARNDLHAGAIELDPAAAAARFGRRLLFVAFFGKIAEGVDRAQTVVRAIDQRAPVATELDVVDFGGERCQALLLEIIGEQRTVAFAVDDPRGAPA